MNISDAVVGQRVRFRRDSALARNHAFPDGSMPTGQIVGFEANAYGEPILLVAWDNPTGDPMYGHLARRLGEDFVNAFETHPCHVDVIGEEE
jgi:hypothetical protein